MVACKQRREEVGEWQSLGVGEGRIQVRELDKTPNVGHTCVVQKRGRPGPSQRKFTNPWPTSLFFT